jgi:hypothetical protein
MQKKSVLPFGELTKYIVLALKEAAEPMYTTDIFVRVRALAKLHLTPVESQYLRTRVRRRMKAMAQQGKLLRHHCTDGVANDEGLWSLARAEEQEEDGPLRRAA